MFILLTVNYIVIVFSSDFTQSQKHVEYSEGNNIQGRFDGLCLGDLTKSHAHMYAIRAMTDQQQKARDHKIHSATFHHRS